MFRIPNGFIAVYNLIPRVIKHTWYKHSNNVIPECIVDSRQKTVFWKCHRVYIMRYEISYIPTEVNCIWLKYHDENIFLLPSDLNSIIVHCTSHIIFFINHQCKIQSYVSRSDHQMLAFWQLLHIYFPFIVHNTLKLEMQFLWYWFCPFSFSKLRSEMDIYASCFPIVIWEYIYI